MRNKIFLVASLLIVASMVLGACASPTPETIIEEVVKTVDRHRGLSRGEVQRSCCDRGRRGRSWSPPNPRAR